MSWQERAWTSLLTTASATLLSSYGTMWVQLKTMQTLVFQTVDRDSAEWAGGLGFWMWWGIHTRIWTQFKFIHSFIHSFKNSNREHWSSFLRADNGSCFYKIHFQIWSFISKQPISTFFPGSYLLCPKLTPSCHTVACNIFLLHTQLTHWAGHTVYSRSLSTPCLPATLRTFHPSLLFLWLWIWTRELAPGCVKPESSSSEPSQPESLSLQRGDQT